MEKLKGRGIVFKDNSNRLQMFITDDNFEHLEVPSIPLNDSNKGISNTFDSSQFYFVKFTPIQNEYTKKFSDKEIKENFHNYLVKHNYTILYSENSFGLNDTTVVDLLKTHEFWKLVKEIYKNEEITFKE